MLSRKITYIFLIIVSVLFYIFFIEKLSFYILVFVLSLPIILLIILLFGKFLINYSISPVSKTAVKYNNCSFNLSITNKTIFPYPTAIVNIEYKNKFSHNFSNMKISIPIHSHSSQTLNFTLSSEYSGIINVKIKSITIFDYLKLFSLNIKKNTSADVYIIPESYSDTYPNNFITLPCETNTEFSKVKSGDDPSEIFDLKDYIPGDKLNRIHWNLSSKQNQLITKHYSLSIDSPIAVITDITFNLNETKLSEINVALEIFYNISLSLLESGIHHDLYFKGFHEPIFISDYTSLKENYVNLFGKNPENENANIIIDNMAFSKSKIFLVTNKPCENYPLPNILPENELKCFFTGNIENNLYVGETGNIKISLIDSEKYKSIPNNLLY